MCLGRRVKRPARGPTIEVKNSRQGRIERIGGTIVDQQVDVVRSTEQPRSVNIRIEGASLEWPPNANPLCTPRTAGDMHAVSRFEDAFIGEVGGTTRWRCGFKRCKVYAFAAGENAICIAGCAKAALRERASLRESERAPSHPSGHRW